MSEELDRLQRWKDETIPIIRGLQELGKALDVPLGTRITGEGTAEIARKLVAERDALLKRCDLLWAERDELRTALKAIHYAGTPYGDLQCIGCRERWPCRTAEVMGVK